MGLAPGTRIGPYEVAAPIGEGGMGEVYRARDSKLKREVAIKVLPPAFAADAERMARFQREAELLASLNHPNIATIHGVESGALVMELVDGENLRGPLSLDAALPLAKQIADALEYAHDRGIIHRDLKPANVKVTSDGAVKLLDFGLAKAVEDPAAQSDVANSPTLTLGATRAGIILGTAAYMSPEQAHGRPADRRSDVWSFGAVLFEMLTGQPAFSGESVSETLASVLKIDPDWAQLPANTPSAIRKLLQRCLTRDRKQRLQAIGEARIVLEDVLAGKTVDTPDRAAPPRASWPWWTGWIAAGALALIAIAASIPAFRASPAAAPSVVRLADPISVRAVSGGMAFSRDGSTLAYIGGPEAQIHVRRLDRFESDVLPGTEQSAFLSFSPDGRALIFVSPLVGGAAVGALPRLKKITLDGGPVQALAEAVPIIGPPTAVWENDTIFFSSNGVLYRLPASGGAAVTLATPDMTQNEGYYAGPQLLPGARHLLVSLNLLGGVTNHRVLSLDLQTGEKKVLLEKAGLARYLPTMPDGARGHLVYYDATLSVLMAVPFDASRLVVAGTPAPVIEGIEVSRGPFGTFAISDTGTLAYVAGVVGVAPDSRLVWVKRDGTEEATNVPARAFSALRLSPDGQRVATTLQSDETLWVVDLSRGALQRLTSEGQSANPVWTADGTRLFYERRPLRGAAVMMVPADASGPPTVVLTSNVGPVAPMSVSADGKLLLGNSPSSRRLWVMPVADAAGGKDTGEAFLDTTVPRYSPVFSPDGKWVAYRSTESGANEIYVVPYPGPGPKIAISVGGASGAARWSHTGREIFYRNGDKMMVVEIETAPKLRVMAPKVLFEGRYGTNWDIDGSDQRFLMIKLPVLQQTEGRHLNFVLNWFEELRRRVPFPSQ